VISCTRESLSSKSTFRSAGAVQALGKISGDGRFPGVREARKKVGVRDSLLRDGVGQRLRDVFLPYDIGETLRAVFSGDDLV